MKPRSIKTLLLICALLTPVVRGQDQTENIRGIERKVLLKQRREAVQSVIDTAREESKDRAADTRDLVGRQLQWLTLVNNRIGEGARMSDAEDAEAVRSATMVNDMAWSLIIPADAGARRPETALKLVTFAIELGGHDKVLRPRMLDTRARALFVLGRNAEAIAGQGEAVAAAQPGEERAGFEATLDSYQKNELPEVAQPAMGPYEPSSGVQYIMEKLKTIVIPSVEFDDVSLEEAMDFFRKKAIELDTAEPDPSRKGVNFVIRKPRATPASEGAAGEDLPAGAVDPGSLRIKGLHLRNVPLAVALRYVSDATRCRFKVDDFAVTFVSLDMPEPPFTRVFRVPPDFAANVASGAGIPFPSNPADRPPLADILKSAGVLFGEGCSAVLTVDGTLMAINTPDELDKIEQLIAAMTGN